MELMVLFGTESGNAEEVARGIETAFRERIEIRNMADSSPDDFDSETFYLIVCSTHGGGELPGFAQFLHDDLAAASPDLTNMRYAMFGLGDSSYEKSYNQGSIQFDELLARLGAHRIGPFGEHDVMTKADHVRVGVDWAREVLALAD
jgi:MioC protein